MPLSAILYNHRRSQFYWWRWPEDCGTYSGGNHKKNLWQILAQIVYSLLLATSSNRTRNFLIMVICTDYMGWQPHAIEWYMLNNAFVFSIRSCVHNAHDNRVAWISFWIRGF